MAKPNNGGSAFPAYHYGDDIIRGGMSLRQWYAGLAMQGLLACSEDCPAVATDPDGIELERRHYASNVAAASCRYADAMIAELNES